VEDACDMELLLRKFSGRPSWSMATLLTGTLDRTSPRCLGHCADPLPHPRPPSLGVSSYLRVRPHLQVRPASSGYTPLFSSLPVSFRIQPARLSTSLPVAVTGRCPSRFDMRTCTAGNARVNPSPVSLFLELSSAEAANRY
jgi:hypothetical protein